MRGPNSTVGGARLIREIGRGAMGAVYLGERCDGWEQVAVKLIHPELAANPEIVQRFFAEARAIARVRHEHVVRLEDFGQDDSGTCYLIMELLDGESLNALIGRLGKLPVERAVALAIQIADGIAAAHAEGVIHRDLKPENVMVTARNGGDFVKVLDFGVAKISGDSPSTHSHAGAMLGTPHYMAPEAARGSRSVDHRVDIYALGCIVFEMLTGSVVFPSQAFAEVLVRQVYDQPPLPSSLNPDIPAALEQVILRALSKDPHERYASMTEMAAALRQLQGFGLVEGFTDDTLADLSLVPTLEAIAHPITSDPAFERALAEAPRSLQSLHGEVTVVLASERPTPPHVLIASAPPLPRVEPIFTAEPDEVTRFDGARGQTIWDEPEQTSNVPPLVALQLIQAQRAALAREVRLRRVMASSITAVFFVVVGLAFALGGSTPARVEEVSIVITTEPAGAEVSESGRALGNTPLLLRRPRAAQHIALHVTKPGYHAIDQLLSTNSDQLSSRKLVPERSAAPAAPAELPAPSAASLATGTAAATAAAAAARELPSPAPHTSHRHRSRHVASEPSHETEAPPATSQPALGADDLVPLRF